MIWTRQAPSNWEGQDCEAGTQTWTEKDKIEEDKRLQI